MDDLFVRHVIGGVENLDTRPSRVLFGVENLDACPFVPKRRITR